MQALNPVVAVQRASVANWRSIAVLAVVSLSQAGHAMADNLSAQVRADLLKVSTQRIYFGHQSVGDNLLAGLRQLSQEAQVALNITEFKSADQVRSAALGHTYVSENTLPLQKLKSFEQAMGGKAPSLDMAMLKFCYVDIHPGTDVQQLFTQYRQTMTRLQTANPGLKLVHMTTPLTTIQTGWKASLKRLLGKAPHGVLENIKREEYNQLVRQTYGPSDIVFDLARVETQGPDGAPFSVEWKNTSVPALRPQYSDDGQHLNALGQRHAAQAFVAVLAKAVRTP